VRDLPFSELEAEAAAGGFDELRRLGRGGSCFVYRGELHGLPVAVKRLSRITTPGAMHPDGEEWGEKQFKAEMDICCRVSHRSICRLFASSADGPQRCLVLELCTGGALDTRLARKAEGSLLRPRPPPLQWDTRLRIACEITAALAHLHSLDPPIIHRDVKTANVLLNGADRAKVADFGISRVGAMAGRRTGTHRTTADRAGTALYMPHEYHLLGQLSERTDSYAFGIVLMELITGRSPQPAAELFTFEGPEVFGRLHELADAEAGEWPPRVLKRLGAIANECLGHVKTRAKVSAVVPKLEALLARHTQL
jgi:serine/threonine protein kinase